MKKYGFTLLGIALLTSNAIAGSSKGWLLSADAGVLFQGKPKVTLTESTGTVSQSNIDTEIASIKHDVDALKQIPVVSLGIAYKF